MRGFTLVEVMVVVVILGLLATLIVPNVFEANDWAKIEKARADISSLKSTVDMYMIGTGSREAPPWEVLIKPDARGKLWLQGFTQTPRDPYGKEYQLRPGDGNTDLEVVSWGPDGQEGTADDISSRSLRDPRR